MFPVEYVFPENFANFKGKHLCWSVFLNKVRENLAKKRLQHRYFPVKFAKFLKTPSFEEHPPKTASIYEMKMK